MTIIEKLNLNKYQKLLVVNQPEGYHIFNQSADAISGVHDAIFIFVESMDEMKLAVAKVIKESSVNDNGYLFIAYSKKNNNKYKSFIHRDHIFPELNVDEEGYVKDSHLKFSRMVSMDDVFTVVGMKNQPKRVKSTSPSQYVGDYAHLVEDIQQLLSADITLLKFFNSLTPGYQRDWARFIYSAKQEKTRVKRIEEMKMILGEGYKSKDLYRSKK
ncbi:YdeI/OmpD-associated family protein [Macrococcus lamae]|uniref:YdeI/OmpD-associated family protein n=1 Tax=Macrococcus lamae TaxID=198484 RepID=A0A4R6BXR9_9STAP|nr:YdeI/OmpD-associated family protein [Macrococcus lamae]TDM13058.1 hypothetical protein ERX29_00200 [Macrococcus lamae]